MKSILITGCSSGIGLAAALTLIEKGYLVIASCRKQSDVLKLQEEGIKHVILLDLASSESIESAVKQVEHITRGQLYALFNNAAFGIPGAVEDLSREALRYQFETNVFGTHELTCLLLPMLLRQSSSRIIQNSSVLGFVAIPNRGAYIASKFALEGLTDTLRLELAGTPVKVCLIEPGPITSAFRKNALMHFRRFINIDASRHKEMYKEGVKRLETEGATMKFTLPASAVVDRLIHALESPRPKARYYVTVPTYFLGYLKRLLPTSLLDKFVLKFANA